MEALRHLALLLALATPSLAQDRPNTSGGELIPEQAVYDVRRYDLRLEVDPAAKTLEGTLGMDAVAVGELGTLALDLDPHLKVRSVQAAPHSITHRYRDGRIWVTFVEPLAAGTAFRVDVAYGGIPREAPRPPWDGGLTWETTADGRPWIATSCQGQGADLWWPCKDHPSDKPDGMDLAITVPEGLVCAANGVLVDEATQGGKTTWTWRVSSPISNYAVALNIAPYEILESSWRSVDGTEVPVVFYVLPEDVDRGRKRLPEFIDHMRFFEEFLGPYPFRHEKYGIVQTPHLGMEHQTIIAYGYDFRHNWAGYDWLHHHEAAHEWWANLVTCSDWKDMWIHEGIGTYMQTLYVERLLGPEGRRRELAQLRRGIGNRKAVAPREVQDSQEIYFGGGGGNDIYNKGALICHALRWHLGDEVFFKALRTAAYPTDKHLQATDGSQVRLVDSDNIRAIFEQVSGQDLKWFFDVYLHQPALPELVAKREGQELTLSWKLPPDVDPELAFPLDVPLRVGAEDAEIQRIDLADGPATVTLPAGAEFELDPELWLLRARER